MVGDNTGHLVGSEAGQAHAPPEQISFDSAQTFPHAKASGPQFSRSVSVLVQNVPQSSSRGATHWQIPPEQPSPGRGHAFPHAVASGPQFAGSTSVLVQKVPQSSGFAPKQPQTPPAQPAPGFAHGALHAPQAAGSVWRSRQRGTSVSQRVVLPEHWQTPPEHVPGPQAIPQALQLFASVAGSTQIPPQRTWPEGQSSSFDGQPASARARPARQRIPLVGRATRESYASRGGRAPAPPAASGRVWRAVAERRGVPG